MSPLSWPVLLTASLLSSPAVWAATVTRTISTDVAMTRSAVCLVAAWAALSLAAHLADRSAPPARPGAQETTETEAESAAR